MGDHYEEKYTKPKLRREIKDSLMQSNKGGRTGQWSARKSQLLVQEYERRGGGYKKKADDDAKSLRQWTNQNWQTSDGSAYADDGERMRRYLPEKAWDLLSEQEKQKAEQKKAAGDANGRQFVGNTIAAKAARAYVDHGDARQLSRHQLLRLNKDELLKLAQKHDIHGRSSMNKVALASAVHNYFAQSTEHLTRDQLYEQAKIYGIEGRSKMDKKELVMALKSAREDD